MEFGIETLRGNPLFDASALERALQDFSQGNDRSFEPLLTVTGVAQWYDLVSRSKSFSAPQIREVSITESFENANKWGTPFHIE